MHLLAAAAAPTFEVSSWFFDWAGLIPAIMAASFLLTLFFGKRLGKHVHFIGLTAVVASFLLSILTAAAWVNATNSHDEDDHGEEAAVVITEFAGADDLAGVRRGSVRRSEAKKSRPRPEAVVNSWCWFDSSDAQNTDCDDRASEKPISIGTLVDGQSVLLLVVVTFISMLVHIFSTDYVGGDRRYVHYFAFLSLFTASMLFFVLSAQHAADDRGLGVGRRLFVRPDRPLVGGETQLRRRPEGVPHQPRRRHRPAHRCHRSLLRCRQQLRHPHHQPRRCRRRHRATARSPSPRCV